VRKVLFGFPRVVVGGEPDPFSVVLLDARPCYPGCYYFFRLEFRGVKVGVCKRLEPARCWDGGGWTGQWLVAGGCCNPIPATICYGRDGVEAAATGGGFFAGDEGVSAAPCARGLDLTCWVMGCSAPPAAYNLANVGVGGV
jgi:hypothetical protein